MTRRKGCCGKKNDSALGPHQCGEKMGQWNGLFPSLSLLFFSSNYYLHKRGASAVKILVLPCHWAREPNCISIFYLAFIVQVVLQRYFIENFSKRFFIPGQLKSKIIPRWRVSPTESAAVAVMEVCVCWVSVVPVTRAERSLSRWARAVCCTAVCLSHPSVSALGPGWEDKSGKSTTLR